MNIKNRTTPILFLLSFVPVVYLFLDAGLITELVDVYRVSVDGAFVKLLGVLIVAGKLGAMIIGIGIVAAIFWFAVDRAGQIENQISEEEAYYYYDYPDKD